MASSSVAVGLVGPPYFAVLVSVLCFFCGVTLPHTCTTKARCLALASIVPVAITGLWLRLHVGIENNAIRYSCWFLLAVILIGSAAFTVLVHRLTRMHMIHRKSANPHALEVVKQRLEAKRIIRDEEYDIYLPPKDFGSNASYPVGFFMLPGALLEHNVYAAVLSKLSDAGILTVVQNCEPFRLASGFFTSDKSIKALIEQIKDKHHIEAEKWSIGGHSLGGHTAVVVAKHSSFFSSLVMYGVNASQRLEETGCLVRALAMTASQDGLLHSRMSNVSTFDNWGEGETKGRLHYVVIEGGNHSGFGDYPRQEFPLLDGERTISLEEQHQQIVAATVKFLLPKQE